jgi:hypothetical protein
MGSAFLFVAVPEGDNLSSVIKKTGIAQFKFCAIFKIDSAREA